MEFTIDRYPSRGERESRHVRVRCAPSVVCSFRLHVNTCPCRRDVLWLRAQETRAAATFLEKVNVNCSLDK